LAGIQIQGTHLPSGEANLWVVDASGKMVFSEVLSTQNGTLNKGIQLPEVKGIYFIKISAGKETFSSTIFKD
jgi:hypothetical protein